MKKVRNAAILLSITATLITVFTNKTDAKAYGGNPKLNQIAVESPLTTLALQHLEQNISSFQEEGTAEADEEGASEEESASEEPVPVIEMTEEDYQVLLKIVEAEATGADIKGKILVANVVINRVNHPDFEDTITDVVYQRTGGCAQFSPVADGRIDRVTVTEETIEAVDRAIYGEDYSEGALYFVARSAASAKNMRWFEQNLELLFTHAGHEFYA